MQVEEKVDFRTMRKFCLVGLTFNKLTVASFEGKVGYANMWNCTCDCGGCVVATTNNLTSGLVPDCGCVRKKARKDRSQIASLLHDYKKIAHKKNKSMTLTAEIARNLLEKQDGKCALTGEPISFQENSAYFFLKEQDRGYTQTNVVLVHENVHKMATGKSNKGEFIRMCTLIAQFEVDRKKRMMLQNRASR